MASLLSLLRQRPDFRRLWLGETLSLVGDWLSYVAVSLLALAAGEGALALAIVFAAHVLPAALVSPWAGTLADRVSRRRILVGTQLLMAALMVAMVFAAAHGALLLVEILLFARTSVGGFFYPAKQAAMLELVATDELVDANAIDTATWSLSFTFGTALGGVIAMAGPVVALSIDAATFVAAGLVFSGLPELLAPARPSSEPSSTAGDLSRAFGHARTVPALLEATLTKAPVAFAGGAAWLALNFRAETLAESGQLLAATALALGLLQAVRGVGTGVGPVLAKRLIGHGIEARSLLRASAYLTFGAIAAFALVRGPWLSLFFVLLWGVGSGGYWVFSSAEIQRLAPVEMIGRIAGIDQLTMTLAMSVAALLGALAVAVTSSIASAAWTGVLVGLGLYVLLRLFVARSERIGSKLESALVSSPR